MVCTKVSLIAWGSQYTQQRLMCWIYIWMMCRMQAAVLIIRRRREKSPATVIRRLPTPIRRHVTAAVGRAVGESRDRWWERPTISLPKFCHSQVRLIVYVICSTFHWRPWMFRIDDGWRSGRRKVRWFYNGNGDRLVWKHFMQRTKLAVKTACIALACVGIKCLVYELKNLSANTKVNHSGLLEIMHQYYVCSGSSVKCDYQTSESEYCMVLINSMHVPGI